MGNQNSKINQTRLNKIIENLQTKLNDIKIDDMKKIINRINQLPKYECHDPSNEKIDEYCIPNLKEEHMIADELLENNMMGLII